MAITNIRLQNFRSYKDESFEFEPGVNIIVGPNGSGKTNLLESILVSVVGSSYRSGDMELVSHGSEWSRVDSRLGESQRSTKIIVEGDRAKKSYIFDDKPYKILTFNHILPVVLFEPNHLQLLHGQPERRREYIDNLLEQLIPTFKITRKQYRRILSQRNALLKSTKTPTRDQLFIWDLRLSEFGGVIAAARQQFIDDLNSRLPTLYKEIAGNDKTEVTVSYKSKLPKSQYESALLQALEKSFSQDLARGFTTYGPHRDDFVVSFNGRPAEEVASRGETRTAMLALKVHELQLLEKSRGSKPLLLLDDVFSELDGKRRHSLTEHLKSYQTFITTTDADVVVQNFLDKCNVIPLT